MSEGSPFGVRLKKKRGGASRPSASGDASAAAPSTTGTLTALRKSFTRKSGRASEGGAADAADMSAMRFFASVDDSRVP